MRYPLRTLLSAVILAIIGIGGAMLVQTGAYAVGENEDPRRTEIVVSVTEYTWWLARWSNNEIVCVVGIEQEGIPGNLDVLADCGQTIYTAWVKTKPCDAAGSSGNTSECPGFYLFFIGQETVQKTVIVDLPKPSVWLNLTGCTPKPPLNSCDEIPSLVLTGEEPLPNEAIVSIHVLYGAKTFDCAGERCEVPLESTIVEGEEIEFWGVSSFGDETEHYTARVRVVDAGVPAVAGTGNWYVDVISSQWRGADLGSCAAMWEAFPPLGGEPQWLTTPPDHTGLASDTPFVFLAGELIRSGVVDASTCPDLGLLGNGAASVCGVEAARSIVNDWQDQFDLNIYTAAAANNIPAQLLKNMFAQESQFWPGQTMANEYGLGQLTEQGADTTLLWNVEFFNQFCPLVLHEETCSKGYAFIDKANQEILRGALAAKSGAECTGCIAGVDLAHAQTTIDLFAETVVANCSQVAFIVSDITGEMPGVVSSYEDLWRFTLASYNAGPYCLAKAMNLSWSQRTMDWQSVSSRFTAGCAGAIDYIDRITRDRMPVDADFLPSPTPTNPSSIVIPPTSLPGTPAPTPTQGPSGYPPPPTSPPGGYPPPFPSATPGYP